MSLLASSTFDSVRSAASGSTSMPECNISDVGQGLRLTELFFPQSWKRTFDEKKEISYIVRGFPHLKYRQLKHSKIVSITNIPRSLVEE